MIRRARSLGRDYSATFELRWSGSRSNGRPAMVRRCSQLRIASGRVLMPNLVSNRFPVRLTSRSFFL